MSTNIAINGMGRIGRMVLRIALKNKNLNVVAINASYPSETIAHLINYDTTHGTYDKKVEATENGIKVDNHEIKLVSDRNPENLPWNELDIDIVIEATGKFNHGDKAIAHINAGAKKVLLTGPSKGGEVQMIVKGVNDDKLDINQYDIFSNASCTTNCIGPVAKVLNDKFGIVNGLMTTVHAITNDQKILIILIRIYVEHVLAMKVLFQLQLVPLKRLKKCYQKLKGNFMEWLYVFQLRMSHLLI